MSRFDPLATRVQHLQASVDWLKALVEQAIDGSGLVRQTGGGGTVVGVPEIHTHEGVGEGGRLQNRIPPGCDEGEEGEAGPPGPPGIVVVGDYGEISIDDNGSGQTLDTSGQWYKITQFDTNGESSGMTPDQANNKITVARAGTYTVTFSCSFNGTASTVYHFDIYVDGAPQHQLAMERGIGTANDVGAVSITGFIVAGAGEDVEIYVSADGNTKNYLQGHANLNVRAIRLT